MSCTDANHMLRRSITRLFIIERMGEDALRYDVESFVTDLLNRTDMLGEMYDLTVTEFWDLAGRFEFDSNGLTDAMLEEALAISQTGWVAMIRRPTGDVDMIDMVLKPGVPLPTETQVSTLLMLTQPAGTEINVLPLVG